MSTLKPVTPERAPEINFQTNFKVGFDFGNPGGSDKARIYRERRLPSELSACYVTSQEGVWLPDPRFYQYAHSLTPYLVVVPKVLEPDINQKNVLDKKIISHLDMMGFWAGVLGRPGMELSTLNMFLESFATYPKPFRFYGAPSDDIQMRFSVDPSKAMLASISGNLRGDYGKIIVDGKEREGEWGGKEIDISQRMPLFYVDAHLIDNI